MREYIRHICPQNPINIDEIKKPSEIEWSIVLIYKNGDIKLSGEKPNPYEIVKAFKKLKL